MSQTLIRLDDAGVTFGSGRLARWFGASEPTVCYRDILSLAMTEPRGLRRGRLHIQLNDGDTLVVSFGPRALLAMRSTYRQMWARVKAARTNTGPGA